MTLLAIIQKLAHDSGFDNVGVTSDLPLKHADYLVQWLRHGKNAGMAWLAKYLGFRLNPAKLLPGLHGAIVLAVPYAHEPEASSVKIARYAYGKDYHLWMRERLNRFVQDLQKHFPKEVFKSFVDTGPVVERDLAQKAGLGWIGKNTCLIHLQKGSYFFLAVVLTSLQFHEENPHADACLNCRLCLDACPTGALTPYQLDANLCLAYHNIEHRGPRDPHFYEKIGDRLVGCDDCQEVCPYNRHPDENIFEEWRHSFSQFKILDPVDALKWSKKDYKKKFRDSAISRIRFEDFMRNVFIVLANTKRHDCLASVRQWRIDNPGLAEPEVGRCEYKLSK